MSPAGGALLHASLTACEQTSNVRYVTPSFCVELAQPEFIIVPSVCDAVQKCGATKQPAELAVYVTLSLLEATSVDNSRNHLRRQLHNTAVIDLEAKVSNLEISCMVSTMSPQTRTQI